MHVPLHIIIFFHYIDCGLVAIGLEDSTNHRVNNFEIICSSKERHPWETLYSLQTLPL